ncbi:hypothetical protein ACS3QZ_01105 [Shimia sp. W99]
MIGLRKNEQDAIIHVVKDLLGKMKRREIFKATVVAALGVSNAAEAQQTTGWAAIVDGLAVYQSETDLSGGGAFSVDRQFLRVGALYRSPEGASFGVLASFGRFSYDFNSIGSALWGDVRDIRLSAPIRFGVGEHAKVLISPSVRWDYENDASASDGVTYGVFAGVSWEISDTLEIGPAFGAFSQLGSNDLDLFPALLVSWDMAPRWNLSTGTGLGASQGPGVTLSHQATDRTRISFIARSEKSRFRLDNAGLAPGGVGEDTSVPVVLSLVYTPNPGASISAFAGAELDGRLKLENTAGTLVSSQSFVVAPILGLSFRFMF